MSKSTIAEACQIPKQERTEQPGLQTEMKPPPVSQHIPSGDQGEVLEPYRPAGKLQGKIALITGGDSGIGRAIALMFALEGAAHIAIVYLPQEEKDAQDTKAEIEKQGSTKVSLLPYDLKVEENARKIVKEVVDQCGRIDVLVNNAGIQHYGENIEEIGTEQLKSAFDINVFSMFNLTKYAVAHMSKGSTIINTASVTAYKGNPKLLDYSATKGAIVAFTRSLALQLTKRGIRVNAVAPGPIWTPLIKSTFPPEEMEKFGTMVPMGRPAQPAEVAPSYVFLACGDSSYYTGQVLHPNGGSVVGA